MTPETNPFTMALRALPKDGELSQRARDYALLFKVDALITELGEVLDTLAASSSNTQADVWPYIRAGLEALATEADNQDYAQTLNNPCK